MANKTVIQTTSDERLVNQLVSWNETLQTYGGPLNFFHERPLKTPQLLYPEWSRITFVLATNCSDPLVTYSWINKNEKFLQIFSNHIFTANCEYDQETFDFFTENSEFTPEQMIKEVEFILTHQLLSKVLISCGYDKDISLIDWNRSKEEINNEDKFRGRTPNLNGW
jgi:hypothetical protein